MKSLKILLLLFLVSVSASAATLIFDDKDGKIEFHATTHPVGVNVNGTGPAPKGSLISDQGKLTGELTIDLTQLEAGMALRTNHMKQKVFEVEKYPEAKLMIKDLKLIAGADSVPFQGDLTLHGVTKPVEGKAKIDRKETSMNVNADFDIKLTDFAIVVKPFAGVSVDDKVSVTVDTKANFVSTSASPAVKP
jgi:polyisoprenoid-binding protein YceI